MSARCRLPADEPFEEWMAAAKRPKKLKTVAEGWSGFAGRLRYAIAERQRQAKEDGRELTQNDIAEAAHIDSGQITKIATGKRALGVTANTLLLLAKALDVRPIWLMTGEEPSGLSAKPEQTITNEEPAPASEATPASRGPAVASGT